ncbi:MAG: bifunctional demethylmenaquinone methyltransferase/2-methoxy-6-polyprenyl-1,4-benzoquinol methylase UbiE [Betaproteobacteria bacterium]
MSLEQRDLFIKHIFTSVAPYVDSLSSGFSFGFDRFWRTQAVALSGIHEGDRVLDVCTGTGELALLLARKVGVTGSVTGADFCEEMLKRARQKTGTRYRNLSYILSDAKRLPFRDNAFDAVTVAFGMRNIPDTLLALQEITRVLKPGGKFVCLELTNPRVRWFQWIYKWYVFRIMPLIGGLVVKTAAPYLYLPRSINAFYSPDEFRHIIAESGFSSVVVDSMTMGIATLYRAVKRG